MLLHYYKACAFSSFISDKIEKVLERVLIYLNRAGKTVLLSTATSLAQGPLWLMATNDALYQALFKAYTKVLLKEHCSIHNETQPVSRDRPIRIAARRQRELMTIISYIENGEHIDWMDELELDCDTIQFLCLQMILKKWMKLYRLFQLKNILKPRGNVQTLVFSQSAWFFCNSFEY